MSDKDFPKSFIKRMKFKLGDEFESFMQSLEQDAVVSLRYNPLKPSKQFVNKEKIPWCEEGYFLSSRPEFIFDPLIHAGAYYVQEASSMIIAKAIDFSKDLKILDLCASPGGKSTLMLSKMNTKSILFSNELVGKRAEVLKENLVKWGNSNLVATSNRPDAFAPFNAFFDVVLVDAPCSGEGMFRKNNRALGEWTPNKSFVCSIGQKDILDEAIKLVKPNGLLIYSTCTYSEEENDQIVNWFFQKYKSRISPEKIQIKDNWGVMKDEITLLDDQSQEVYRCYPHKIRGEGMFISAFRINHRMQSELPKQKKNSRVFKTLSNAEFQKVNEFIDPNDNFQIVKYADKTYAIPSAYSSELGLAVTRLNLILLGTYLGSFNKKSAEFIPSHDLAMSILIRKDLPSIELSLKQALCYLKKSEINADKKNLPFGWILARYNGHVLGFLKNTKNRLNNAYPKQWAIRRNLPVLD
ncbi:MAG: hypothetical protein H8E61_05065 [Bacteroidetes bacterium]|nr:hypothetical protein [Bacteroidota bacterium]